MITNLALQTNNLILRTLHQADAPAVFKYASDPEITQFMPWAAHTSITDTKKFIAAQAIQTTKMIWAIEQIGTNTIIGECGFANFTNSSADLHYTLARNYWGQGLAYEVVTTLIDFGFETLNLTRIESWIIEHNTRSQRLAKKVGMNHEITLPDYWWTHDQLYDVHIYAINRPECQL